MFEEEKSDESATEEKEKIIFKALSAYVYNRCFFAPNILDKQKLRQKT